MEIARAARPSATASQLTPEELRGQRGGAAPRRADPVADQPPARHAAARCIDEVANGLSYYDYTFLRELPRFYADLEDQLAADRPGAGRIDLPSFLRMGSWIGGDRDGNPFVTDEVLRARRCALQSSRALRFYLDELHLLGGELSLDGRLVGVSDGSAALAARSPDRSPNRQDEPYRRASPASMRGWPRPRWALDQLEAAASRRSGEAPPYRDGGELLGRPRRPARLAGRQRLGDAGARPPARRCAARSMSSASIWRRSTCARTPTCTSASSASCSSRRAPAPTMPRSPRTSASALLLAELGNAAAAGARRISPTPTRPPSELAILRAAAEAHRRYGPAAVPQLRDLQGRQRLRHPRSRACCSRKPGCCGRARAALDVDIVPLFETIDDLRDCGPIMDELLGLPHYRAPARKPRQTCRRSCSAIPTATRTAAS